MSKCPQQIRSVLLRHGLGEADQLTYGQFFAQQEFLRRLVPGFSGKGGDCLDHNSAFLEERFPAMSRELVCDLVHKVDFQLRQPVPAQLDEMHRQLARMQRLSQQSQKFLDQEFMEAARKSLPPTQASQSSLRSIFSVEADQQAQKKPQSQRLMGLIEQFKTPSRAVRAVTPDQLAVVSQSKQQRNPKKAPARLLFAPRASAGKSKASSQ